MRQIHEKYYDLADYIKFFAEKFQFGCFSMTIPRKG